MWRWKTKWFTLIVVWDNRRYHIQRNPVRTKKDDGSNRHP